MKFIFGIPKTGEDSDAQFYEFCKKCDKTTKIDAIIELFVIMRKTIQKPFVSLNPLIFNYIDDNDIDKVGVRILDIDLPIISFDITKQKLAALGIGEILADTDYYKIATEGYTLLSPEDRWVKEESRILYAQSNTVSIYRDMVPFGYKLVNHARPGDYVLGAPHFQTGQIWYLVHAESRNNIGITKV